jgi:hypothetical protein
LRAFRAAAQRRLNNRALRSLDEHLSRIAASTIRSLFLSQTARERGTEPTPTSALTIVGDAVSRESSTALSAAIVRADRLRI